MPSTHSNRGFDMDTFSAYRGGDTPAAMAHKLDNREEYECGNPVFLQSIHSLISFIAYIIDAGPVYTGEKVYFYTSSMSKVACLEPARVEPGNTEVRRKTTGRVITLKIYDLECQRPVGGS